MNCINKNKPDKNKIFIYTLSDPNTKEVRYVGKTKQSLYVRYCDHISIKNNRNNLNYYSKNWIKSLLNKNEKPIIELLDIVDESNWENEEIFYISYFKYLGFNLTNYQQGGGKGCTGLNWKINSEKLKEKHNYLKNSKINIHILYDLNGKIIKKYKNIMVACEDLNMKYCTLYNYIKTKTLIQKKFLLLKENVVFNKNLLKRKYRKVKIYNKEEKIIFNTQKETAIFLNLPISTFNKILHGKIINNTNYKIILL